VSPISNQPSASEINVELGRASNAAFSMDGAEERALAQVPTGPISMNDFIGKSAQTPFDTYLQFIDNLTAGNAVLTGGQTFLNTVTGANHKVTTITEAGNMTGSLWGATPIVFDNSPLSRFIQHGVETYTEFQAITTNNWPCAIQLNATTPGSLFQAIARNNYTSQFDSGTTRTGVTGATMYWWDGTFAWKRVNALARELAYPQ